MDISYHLQHESTFQDPKNKYDKTTNIKRSSLLTFDCQLQDSLTTTAIAPTSTNVRLDVTTARRTPIATTRQVSYT